MSTYWTLEKEGGAEQSFEALGITLNDCNMNYNNGAADVFTFRTTPDFDSAAIAENLDKVTIRRDRILTGAVWSGGSVFFVGYATNPSRDADGGNEQISYELRNWWYLAEITIFKDEWQLFNGWDQSDPPNPTFITVYNANVFLGLTPNGVARTNGAQIRAALDWLTGGTKGRGVALTIGTIEPAVNIFTAEARSMSVAEVIRTMLAHSPDAIVVTDYTTTPNPTVSILKPASLTPTTLTVGVNNFTSIGLTPRYDIQVPAVCCYFKSTSSTDPNYIAWTKQVWPAKPIGWTDEDWESQIGAENHTIELEASGRTTTSASYKARAIDNSSKTWWKTVDPNLASPFISDPDTTITAGTVKKSDGTTQTLAGYRMLTDGQITPWMGYTVIQDVEVKAFCSYTLYAVTTLGGNGGAYAKPPDNQIIKRMVDVELCVKVTLTNAPAGDHTLSTIESWSSGEDEPAGLAQAYQESLATLQYEGTLTDVFNELPAGNPLTNLITLAGTSLVVAGQLVQRSSQNLGRGTRSISIGPSRVLDISSLVELHRVTRVRRTWNNPLTASTGMSGAAGGKVSLADSTSKENTGKSNGNPAQIATQTPVVGGAMGQVRIDADNKKIVVYVLNNDADKTEKTSEGSVKIELADIVGKAAKFRELKWKNYEDGCKEYHAYVLMTLPEEVVV